MFWLIKFPNLGKHFWMLISHTDLFYSSSNQFIGQTSDQDHYILLPDPSEITKQVILIGRSYCLSKEIHLKLF